MFGLEYSGILSTTTCKRKFYPKYSVLVMWAHLADECCETIRNSVEELRLNHFFRLVCVCVCVCVCVHACVCVCVCVCVVQKYVHEWGNAFKTRHIASRNGWS